MDIIKDKFYNELLDGEKEIAMLAGDLNGHVGKSADGVFGYHSRNAGNRILAFDDAT